MYDVFKGVRVLELGAWTFVPACGGICADWGADVIKIEPPDRGDPQRSKFSEDDDKMDQPPDVMLDLPNRGKRSIGIDMRSDDGKKVFKDLVASADVLITSYLPAARKRLGLDAPSLRATNPKIIVGYGSGQGPRGPEAEEGGYDLCSGFARASMGDQMIPTGGILPPCPPAMIDLQSGFNLAAGVAGALFKRERTGIASVVDVSLLSTSIWMAAPNIMAAGYGGTVFRNQDRSNPPINAGVNSYRTGDGRWVCLVLLESERYWEEFCERLGRKDLASDPRFATAAARQTNKRDCVRALDDVFATRTYAQWRRALEGMKGPWGPVQNASEVLVDPQVLANEYVTTIDTTGKSRPIVPGPVQFDTPMGRVAPTPDYGQHSNEILAELGYSDSERQSIRSRGAIR